MSESLTFLVMPESAYGPTNNCIGIGDVLRRRGHRVVFAAEASWEGKLSALGFEEDLVHLAEPTPESSEADPGQFWKDFIRDTAPQFRTTTLEQLATVTEPIWKELADGAMYCQAHLREIVGRSGADAVVEDNVICFPALMTAGVPFVRIMSCNPLEMTGMDIPPAFSGLPSDDPSQWAEFRAEYDRTHRPLWETFNAWVQEQGAPVLPDLEFIHESTHANLYVYPSELDYVDRRPLGPTWHRLDSSVRSTDEPYELPEALREGPGRLVYFSLGSLGSADVELMTRTIDVLAATPHRYIVSTGPLHDEITLAPNMTGAEFPATDQHPAHGGRGDHARRQQHHDRGAPPRPADDRAATVLGPVRQRPARA